DLAVKNAAPQFTLNSDAATIDQAANRRAVSVFGDFTDTGIFETHRAFVDWGDGAGEVAALSESLGAGAFAANHRYASGGSYSVRVTLTDSGGVSTVHSTTVYVAGMGQHSGVLQVFGSPTGDLIHVSQAAGLVTVDLAPIGTPASLIGRITPRLSY